MVTLLQTGAGLALLVGVGHGTLSILGLSRGRSIGEVLALGLLVGGGVVSLVVFWLSLAGVPRALTSTVGLSALWCLAWCMAVLWRWRGRPLRFSVPASLRQRPRSAAAWARLALAGWLWAMVAAMAHTTLATGLGWDGLAIWGLKAKAIYSEGGVSLALFHDLSRQWSHLNYPLLLPTVEAWLYWFLGGVSEGQVKVLFVAYQLSLLARSWGVLWQLVALAALWRPGQASAGERYLLAAPAAYLLPLTASFVFSTWGSYAAHVAASLERLVLHVCPTAVLFLALRASRWSPRVYRLSLPSGSPEAALAGEVPACGVGKNHAGRPLGHPSA